MRAVMLFCLAFLAGCGGSAGPTGPQGKDPTVLFHNGGQYASMPGAAVTWVWFDQSGQVSTTVIQWNATTCIKFTATRLADSVRFVFYAGDTLGGSGQWWVEHSPWFDPATGLVPDIPQTDSAGHALPNPYPYGAEYWFVDYSRTPVLGTLATPPC